MKKSTKAALFSGLIFPGVGHFYLKRYPVGLALSVISLGCISYIIKKSVEQAMSIVDQVMSGAVPADPEVISNMVSQQSSGTEGNLLNLAGYVFLACWVVGIYLAYRAGAQQDQS
jgi:hypothetical protein